HRPGGVVELRFNGRDGSWLATSILVPPSLAAAPRLRILDIQVWYVPTRTLLQPVGSGETDMKRYFLLLLFVDFCRDAVMTALGPGAQHAAWWTDAPPINRSSPINPSADPVVQRGCAIVCRSMQ
ncbi:hypothetical protein, partial [Marivita sp.]|uniref:hypothetical protein n=1 Tax=Marivita sp. TaxID=2003365 RepID=UPI0025BC7304